MRQSKLHGTNIGAFVTIRQEEECSQIHMSERDAHRLSQTYRLDGVARYPRVARMEETSCTDRDWERCYQSPRSDVQS